MVSLGTQGLSACPEPQHPGEGFLGAGVDEVGAGCSAEGFPVPAAKGWEAVHSHEAFVPLPPAGETCQPRGRARGEGLHLLLARRGEAACISGLLPHPMAPTPPFCAPLLWAWRGGASWPQLHKLPRYNQSWARSLQRGKLRTEVRPVHDPAAPHIHPGSCPQPRLPSGQPQREGWGRKGSWRFNGLTAGPSGCPPTRAQTHTVPTWDTAAKAAPHTLLCDPHPSSDPEPSRGSDSCRVSGFWVLPSKGVYGQVVPFS